MEFIWSGEAVDGEKSWTNLVKTMRRDFNGKMMNIVLDGDPYYFYRGRVQFSGVEVSTSGDGNKVKLDYNLMPYKYNREYMTNPLDKILYSGSLTQEQL